MLNAILWTVAIFASGLLHGPLILTLGLTILACWTIVAGDKGADEAGRPRPGAAAKLRR